MTEPFCFKKWNHNKANRAELHNAKLMDTAISEEIPGAFASANAAVSSWNCNCNIRLRERTHGKGKLCNLAKQAPPPSSHQFSIILLFSPIVLFFPNVFPLFFLRGAKKAGGPGSALHALHLDACLQRQWQWRAVKMWLRLGLAMPSKHKLLTNSFTNLDSNGLSLFPMIHEILFPKCTSSFLHLFPRCTCQDDKAALGSSPWSAGPLQLAALLHSCLGSTATGSGPLTLWRTARLPNQGPERKDSTMALWMRACLQGWRGGEMDYDEIMVRLDKQ